MSKPELIQKIAELHPNNMARKDVKGVIESLAEVGYKELKKTGAFFVPGFAKFVVIKKPATKERKGINPFTKEPTTFKAKPARKIIRARPVKAAKDTQAQTELPHEGGFPANASTTTRSMRFMSGPANHFGIGTWSTAPLWPSCCSVDVLRRHDTGCRQCAIRFGRDFVSKS
jgi:nucleoid DNA-binding protein